MLMNGSRLRSIIILIAAALTVPGCTGNGGGSTEQPASAAREPVAPRPESPPATAKGVTAVATHAYLSPQAQIQAETFMCVCGCGMTLAECTCQKDPGGVTMKRHLQGLVDQGLTPSQVEAAMVKAYGQEVLP